MADADVLVVGAGPIGLFTAILLTKFGFKIRIIDQRSEMVNDENRASFLNSRTLEFLHSIDPSLVQEILRVANTTTEIHYYKDGVLRWQEATYRSDSRFQHGTHIRQDMIHGIFVTYLERLGVHVQRSVRLTDFDRTFDTDGVSAVVENVGTGIMNTIDVAYLIGADGIRSRTRMRLGVSIKVIGTPVSWYIANVSIRHSTLPSIEGSNYIENKHGAVIVSICCGNLHYITMPVDPNSENLSQEDVIERVKLILSPFEIDIETMHWFSRIDAATNFVAEEFAQDRVFLVGEAAHCYTPLGGLPFNCGFADSWNLVWKLSMTHRGIAQSSLLETYHEERHATAEKDANMASTINKLSNRMNEFPIELLYKFAKNDGLVTGIGVKYPPNVLNLYDHEDPNLAVHPGMRAPDGRIQPSKTQAGDAAIRLLDLFKAATRFHLLIFTGSLSRNHAALGRLEILVTSPEQYAYTFSSLPVDHPDLFNYVAILPAGGESPPPGGLFDAIDVYYTDIVNEADGLYATYGVDVEDGAFIIVRPDGIVGTCMPLSNVLVEEDYYFSMFSA